MVLYIEDDEYGVLYLAPLGEGWYVGLEEDYPSYYLLRERKRIIKVTRTMPDHVWKCLMKD